MKLSSKKWLICFAILTVLMLTVVSAVTVIADPFFHYHAPYTDRFYYALDNERSQNNGIMRHFTYDGLITGTSMTQNFKASEAEALFGGRFVKLPYAGASYRELNEGIETALMYNPDIRTVIRSVDPTDFFTHKDTMRADMGDYPDYLYNDFLFDDVNYVWNREILFWRSFLMFRRARSGSEPGIDSFDRYSYWMHMYPGMFGKTHVLQGREHFAPPTEDLPFTDEEREIVTENIKQNVTAICAAHPDVTFYYFFPPYSAACWGIYHERGEIEKRIEAERLAIGLMLEESNLKLYSFNTVTDITCNLNNYMDSMHYGEWVNSMMLRCMKDGTCLLTKENADAYLEEERAFYKTFDYNSLFLQEDLTDPPPELQ